MSTPATPGRYPRLRILWSFIRPHRRVLALGLILGLVTTATALATPMVTKWVLDSVGTSTSLAEPIGVLLALLVVGSVVGLWQWILLGTLAERVVLDARESMVRRFFQAKVAELTGRPTGELVTRVTSDTVLLREAASSSAVSLVNGTVALFGTLILMGVLDLVLLTTTLTAIVIVGVLFAMLMPRIAKAEEQAQESVGNLGGVLEGALRAVRTVKASRAEDRQSERIVVQARESARHSVRAVRTQAVAWTIAGGGIQLAIIVILGVGAWRVDQGVLEVSSLIAFLLYAFGIMGPITELTQNITAVQSGIAAASRISQVQQMEVEKDLTDAAQDPVGDRGTDAVLEFRDVRAAYGPDAEPAVDGVTVSIPRVGHTAVVGPSGAGKTTLFSLLLRFIEPHDGEILLDGRPYSSYTHSEIRSRLAYVEQETPIVPGTIRDNLLFTHPDATDQEVWDALRAVKLDEKVVSLAGGLDTELSSTAVSGGQRQRIPLARAILRTPAVLMLDEATAQVDGLTEAAIHDCIRDRASKGAVLTIAHRLSTVIDADTILVMEDGKIRASGTHSELLASDDLYRRLVEALRIVEPAVG
ncbi:MULTISPECIES: ABC transporter ATP-binding protein [unclassified Arthrobacter]|uniref:ABC transporter ATP-binding protein n=1 Tax=unclassified Arthrobacter TaxID=235627 RepID=UPI001491B594|nr:MULTISPECIES: ABC transporter ATP-binding protein [unclassified Arthrobacter]MBE0008362.1 ABC transporter ATP-binding protein [Arthrobacter sp. AET 35A]NOJ62101.1 ABC transporter ATP-binding protein [Arthrobacter sp. 147(2020)]